VYASAKLENNYFGFGTDNDIERTPGYVIVNHRTFGRTAAPTAAHAGEEAWLPCAKVLGAARGRRHAFRPDSVVNISGMSFRRAVGQRHRGAQPGRRPRLLPAEHRRGQHLPAPPPRRRADLPARHGLLRFARRAGRFDLARLKDTVASAPVRALEVKLSQGAKPGLGGVLPAAKVSAEIATTRGVARGVDCISPSRHAAFSDVDSMLDFVEMLADATGLPVGIKSAVGDLSFWRELVRQMAGTGRGVDFVNVDGGEGGMGASPLVFTDTVSMPFRLGFSRVYKIFAEAGLHEDVVFEGGGKLGLPENAVVAFALGADLINVGREAMLAIGCVQAQKCHTDTCPTGVATQNKWLSHGLDPTLKSVRCANYVRTLRRDLLKLAEATGVEHPGLIGSTAVEILTGQSVATPLHEVYGYELAWGFPSPEDRAEIAQLMIRTAPRGDAAPPGVAGSNGATPNGPAPNGLGQVSSTAAAAAPPTRAG
jgi:hypothetical protein